MTTARRPLRALASAVVALGLVAGAGAAAGALQPYVFLLQWGSTGSGNGQFQLPADGTVDTAGNVYVVDQTLGRIQKFTPDGGFIKAWDKACKLCPPFAAPSGIAAGNGAVWLADGGNHRLVKMDTNGAQQLEVPSPPAGQPGAFGAPSRIAVDSQGSVYVVTFLSTQVQVFTATGSYLRTIQTGFGLAAGAVTVRGSTTYVLGSDSGSLRIEKYDRFGGLIGSFPVPGAAGAPGLGIDAQNRLYVSDGSGTIRLVSSTGQVLGQLGSFGSGPLQFNNPAVAVPNALGILYVVDRGNDRVQKITETSTRTVSVTDDVQATPYTFTVSDGPTGVPSFQLDDDPSTPLPGQQTTTMLVPGVYRVQIAGGPNGPKTITCSNGQQVQNYAASFIDVTLPAGTSVSCAFYVEWIG